MQLQNILFPVDFSERCQAVAPFVQSLAKRYGATVTLLHAIPPAPALYMDMGAVYPDAFDPTPVAGILESRLRTFAAEQFPHMKTICTVLDGDPARVIVEFARNNSMDLIALPTHGYGLFRRALVGSVTAKVLHDSTVPVWTDAHACEPSHRAHPQPRRVVAAIDLKERTGRTLETALAIASDAGAAVDILHITPEGFGSPLISEMQVEKAVATAAAGNAVVVERETTKDVQIVTEGESIASVVRRVAVLKRADLVVIGRGSLQGNLLERLHAHTYSVICESPCPVLSV